MRIPLLLLASLALARAQDNGGPQGVGAAPNDTAPEAAADSPVAPSSTSSAACTFCTVPPGYTAEDWDAPLHVEHNFPPRWREAHRKAKDYLKGWSIEEKVNVVTGAGWMQGRCVGNTKPIPARNWTGLCLQDSPLGVRFGDYVSAFPAGINAAST